MKIMQELLVLILRYDDGAISAEELGQWVFEHRYDVLGFLEDYQELLFEKEKTV